MGSIKKQAKVLWFRIRNKVNKTTETQPFHSSNKSYIASVSNSRWQNHKEPPNRSTKNGVMADKAKCDIVREWVYAI